MTDPLLQQIPPSDMGVRSAVGILFATASIGWTVFPMVIGAIATRSTLQRGFLVAVGCGVALLALVTGHFIYAEK